MGLLDTAKSVVGIIEKAKLTLHAVNLTTSQTVRDPATRARTVLTQSTPPMGITSGDRVLTVQYNPSSLMIQATADAVPFVSLQKHIANGALNQNIRPPMVVLSVELIFDEMNPVDSFMMDRLRLSTGTVVSGVAATAKNLKGGYTVQHKTNGLVATMLQPNTRRVTFAWGQMSFTGQVIEAQARYTMFSPSGKPVRSVVTMNIAQQVNSDADAAYWDSAVDKIFQSNSTFGKSLGQMAGNILNLDAI